MNPDPGWARFLFQHGWGGFFGAVVGALVGVALWEWGRSLLVGHPPIPTTS